MKKFIFTLFLIVSFYCLPCYASTIITSPIDSRPISVDYLKNLADIVGDTVLYPSKESMDYFSAVDSANHFGDSKKIREEIRTLVSENNTKDTVVIINTSTYFTNGLVGSRCAVNYTDIDKSMAELESLMKNYPEPTYYINLSMPRTLPEQRFNSVWFNDKSLNGLGYYYLKANPDADDKAYISANFKTITPVQFLMEYSYVENKKAEFGLSSLTDYEKEFLKACDRDKKYYPYKSYLSLYRKPYFTVADMFAKLLTFQEKGLLSEIIISNDDFQLPNSITYFNTTSESDNIIKENSSPIKFSFARTYMTTGGYAITKQLISKIGESETKKSLKGLGDNINFIFGTDEVPQLIYARSLAERNKLSTVFNCSLDDNNSVATFDVLSISSLLKNDINFVIPAKAKKINSTDLYLYNYNTSNDLKLSETLSSIKKSVSSGLNTGIIEIYSNEVLNTGNNALFKSLINKNDINLSDLSFYSAWNTNANAIGLGVAHAQVIAIAKEISNTNNNLSSESLVKAQTKMLLQHLIEDGIYTCNTKRLLSNERYIPSEIDTPNSEKLLTYLSYNNLTDVLQLFDNKSYTLNNETVIINKANLSTYNFPWGRTFEPYLDFNIIF